MTVVFLDKAGIYLYLMLLRLVKLFKTESEAKLIWNVRILNLQSVCYSVR